MDEADVEVFNNRKAVLDEIGAVDFGKGSQKGRPELGELGCKSDAEMGSATRPPQNHTSLQSSSMAGTRLNDELSVISNYQNNGGDRSLHSAERLVSVPVKRKLMSFFDVDVFVSREGLSIHNSGPTRFG